MAIVVVGGSEHGVGKTSLVCGVIAALAERKWIAVKVTSHMHGASEQIWTETASEEGTDTSRYLLAGALRSYLITASEGIALQAALVEFWRRIDSEANVIFESNRVLDFVNPDLCLMMTGGSEPKASFAAAFARADAVVVNNSMSESTGAAGLDASGARPTFRLNSPDQLSFELAEWIRGCLIYR